VIASPRLTGCEDERDVSAKDLLGPFEDGIGLDAFRGRIGLAPFGGGIGLGPLGDGGNTACSSFSFNMLRFPC